MHWLQNLPLHGLMLIKEAKLFIATYFHGIRGNNCLGVFNALTQERNVSGSKKIGPWTSQRSLWRYTLHYLAVSINEIQKTSVKTKLVQKLTINYTPLKSSKHWQTTEVYNTDGTGLWKSNLRFQRSISLLTWPEWLKDFGKEMSSDLCFQFPMSTALFMKRKVCQGPITMLALGLIYYFHDTLLKPVPVNKPPF